MAFADDDRCADKAWSEAAAIDEDRAWRDDAVRGSRRLLEAIVEYLRKEASR